MEDNKTFSFNIGLKQLIVILAIFALCFVAIYTNALVIGYVLVTLALCAFFLAVAFDVGVKRRAQSPRPAEQVSPSTAQRPSGRSARTV